MIPGWSVETRLIKSIIPYLGLISFLELAFPVTSMISLTGVQGWECCRIHTIGSGPISVT